MGRKKSLRNLQNHHTRATTSLTNRAAIDTEDSQVVTPPETATNSSTELKLVDKHEAKPVSSRKRARKDTLGSGTAELEGRPAKISRAEKDGVVQAAPQTAQQVAIDKNTENKRSLRSQDPKKISELALLFQEETPQAYIAKHELIKIVDDEPDAIKRNIKNETSEGGINVASAPNPPPTPHTPIPPARFAPITSFDFSQFERKASKMKDDPLKDELFIPDHRRHAAREKRWRNVENERSQQLYNKLRNELERLKGPDWLKVIGQNRADDEAIRKRDHLITAIETELAKQRRFTEELRKQKRAKVERTLSPEQGSEGGSKGRRSLSVAQDIGGDENTTGSLSKSRLQKSKKASQSDLKTEEKPFTSFFSKAHLRNAATKNWRKSARNAMAFGELMPPIDVMDFELPAALIEEGIKARKR
ncbi:hypothetical protein BDZ91DRAFT_781709 [Kalaharituber pfeilii]|nr:hypothetical protein BDZ91DRAFT_781709 [Kalaharituber pfeilii]